MYGPILGEHGESRVLIFITSGLGGSCLTSADYCHECLQLVLDGYESTIISPQVHCPTRGGFLMRDKPRVRSSQDCSGAVLSPALD